MKKENKNFLYNVVYQVFALLMPLITAPYISRVLGVENIGTFAYTYSIVNYFMLAALIGINNYGSREIAKISRDGDREKLSKLFSEIYYLQFGLGILMLIIYYIGVLLFAEENRIYLLVQGIYIVSAVFDINWFYFGLEKFKITVTRNIVIRLLSLVLIFIFVRSDGDLMKYILIMSLSALASQLYLWIYLKKYVDFMRRNFRDILRHLKGCLLLFIPIIAYSIYRIMDKTMLGAIAGVEPLGYYQNAESIINIPVTLVAALGTVMLPSMSKTKLGKYFEKKMFDSFELAFSFVTPIFFTFVIMGKDLATVFYGENFLISGDIIGLLAITIVFSTVANVIRTCFLIPRRKDNIYVTSTIIGAVINLILNAILIPIFGTLGACVGTIAAEFSVMAYQMLATRTNVKYGRLLRLLCIYILKSIPICVVQIMIQVFVKDLYLRFGLSVIITVLIFGIVNFRYIIYNFFGVKKHNEQLKGR